MTRFFTPHEANDALDIVRPAVDEIIRIRADVLERQPDLWPAIQKVVGNGGSAALSKLFLDFERLDKLVHRIQDLGVHIKDLSVGLLDFPALYEGREIYLCWRFGEDRIEYWHETDSGFAERRIIDWE
jgi:hypothetical protein